MVNSGHDRIRTISFDHDVAASRVDALTFEELRANAARSPVFRKPQRPQFDMLLHVGRGTTVHEVDFTVHRLDDGDFLWVRAGQIQRWGNLNGCEGSLILFLPHVVGPGTSTITARSDAHFRAANHQPQVVRRSRKVLDLIHDTAKLPSMADAATTEHLLEALLLTLVEGRRVGVETSTDSSVYRDFLHLLQQSPRTRRSVEECARLLSCSPRTLNRAVMKYTHRSAKKAIDEHLALEAKRMLVHHPEASVARVGADLGFDDAANFSKFFQRVAKSTPGRFRRDQG